MRVLPPEVQFDARGQQILARTATGEPFRQYVSCQEGCGWLIGCGDAVDGASHQSCIDEKQTRLARLAEAREAAMAEADWRYGPQNRAAYLGFQTGVDTILRLLQP